MKIAIHHTKRSYSDRWIKFCHENNIEYKIVNSSDSRIIQDVEDCDIFLWHFLHATEIDVLLGKRLITALELSGKIVFPNIKTSWFFDDKIAQKYLLEATDSPIINTYVFYNEPDAIEWANKTHYPKVFKLARGAGSLNVQLIRNRSQAKRKITKAFKGGFSQFNKIEYFKSQYKKGLTNGSFIKEFLKAIYYFLFSTSFSRNFHKEKNYIYFQDYIPNNDYDTRVIVIGERAYAIKRMNRKNDFRASGSGSIIYDHNQIDLKCIKVAFEVNNKLKTQCVAYDFVFDSNKRPLIIEISYGFSVDPYDKCPGYWDKDLNWHEGSFNPQYWMIENVIEEYKNKMKHAN